MQFTSTRLAPSPTGALHLGHARTFLLTWWMARQAGAKIFMRMEDLDAGRARLESVQQAYDDLRWLGMDWDGWESQNSKCKTQNQSADAFEIQPGDCVASAIVQSHRVKEYERALERLWQRGMIYPCTCTRAEIATSVAAAGNAPHENEGNVRYPGTCREIWTEQRDKLNVWETTRLVRERTRKNVCWRLRVRDGEINFQDLIAGAQRYDVSAEVGDFPLTRFAGEAGVAGLPAAYQLACVVDDRAMGIDLVVRGDDLLSSTPRQMLLYEALGWPMPRFAHVPLVVGPDGKRLAKRHGESRIAQFRAAGVSPEKIVGWAAWRSGQLDQPREIAASEMVAQFQLAKLPKERLILGSEDFAWLK